MPESHTLNSAIAVANWFIETNWPEKHDLTHLKIQKLLYFVQGFHLAFFDYPLFEDPIEAWKYGPVVKSVYRSLVKYEKDLPITELIVGYQYVDDNYIQTTPKIIIDDEHRQKFINKFWNIYSTVDTWSLVAFTHLPDSPWSQVYNHNNSELFLNEIIPVELIKSYFKKWLFRYKNGN
ncbi:MAG: DUF4065 domain-containing protein [Deltaproteobacteria bacterium]|jgi:uncharacterized phage-associated protein|nr:DUF4065 domain-containing protein [Deltaproteobacteria bacterium]